MTGVPSDTATQQLFMLLAFILAYGGILFVSFKMILKETKNTEQRTSENPADVNVLADLNIRAKMIGLAATLLTLCLLYVAKTSVVFEEHPLSFMWMAIFTMFFHSGSLSLSLVGNEPGYAVLRTIYCFVAIVSGISGLLVVSYVFLFECWRLLRF